MISVTISLYLLLKKRIITIKRTAAAIITHDLTAARTLRLNALALLSEFEVDALS